MSAADERAPLRPRLAELFALANLAFLTVDILVAHAVTGFAHAAEWIPIAFSPLAAAALLPGVIRGRHHRGFARAAGYGVGAASILVGMAGVVFHLQDSFFRAQTLKSLVYAAPFVGPLAYAGVGLLLILNRMEGPGSRAWGPWVVFLALGGFVGNLILAVLDHAQNGFFVWSEWISVAAAAFAVGFLLPALSWRGRLFYRLCLAVMVLEMLIGVLGLVLHGLADLRAPGDSLRDRFLYGAPIFAPLLFPNLAILAAIGLWEVAANAAPPRSEPAAAPGILQG